MSKHTPGLWRGNTQTGVIFHRTKGFWIARLWNGFRRKERKELTHLIAAAPDMLEALEEVCGTYGTRRSAAVARAQHVIAKANGETE